MSSFDEVKGAISGNYEILKGNISNTDTSFSKFGEISSKEQDVIDKINEMSKIISCYKVKEYNDNNPDYQIQEEDYCYSNELRLLNKDSLNTHMASLYSDINALINDQNYGLKKLLNDTTNRSNIIRGTSETGSPNNNLLNVADGKSIEDVLTNYNNLQSNRNKLKTTLSELKSEKGTFSRESELHLDATIYSSILFTTVATGLLYYVFTAL
jgi:hypothetical protein